MKSLLPISLGLLLIIGLSLVALSNQRKLEAGLPPAFICKDETEAFIQASAYAAAHGGEVSGVCGTGSMAPYIPAAKPGTDPYKIVAFAVSDPVKAFDSVKVGDLIVYSADWHRGLIIHQAAQREDNGWIMTGLHNAGYEAHWRMTQSNFRAVVAAVFTIP